MEAVSLLSLDLLLESPTNPRKTFDDAGLQELADSITSQGLLQPIVVRPITGSANYEIVFGHRRYRAALLAELNYLPCIVRPMTDQAASIAQLHENLEREDVHPIEEAEAFRRLMDDHKISADQIARDTGKSRTYIYNRLKLATLTPEVRKACMSGDVGAEIATLIARVPLALQAKALERCHTTDHFAHKPVTVVRSYRDARRELERGFTRTLADATFNPSDHLLVPIAGSCDHCHDCSSNDPGLSDFGAYVCTNVPCYEGKDAAHIEQVKERAIRQGLWIEKFSHATHTSLDSYLYTDHTSGTVVNFTVAQALDQLRADAQPLPVVYTTLRPATAGERLIECVMRSDAEAMRLAAKARPAEAQKAAAAQSTPSTAARGADLPGLVEDAAPEVRAVLDRESWLAVRTAIMLRVRQTPRTTDDLRLLLLRMVEDTGCLGLAESMFGWSEVITDTERRAALAAMGADDLAALLVMAAIDNAYGYHRVTDEAMQDAADRLALARRYGVDPLSVPSAPVQMVDAGSAGDASDATTVDLFEAADA